MDIEKEITSIQERNRRVEIDKAWETSFLRRVFIVLVTYCASYVLLSFIHTTQPYLGALVPCLGYILSTLSLPPLRSHWEKFNKK